MCVWCKEGEWMVWTCIVPPWSMEEVVWRSGGALVVTLLRIHSKLQAHWTNMATMAVTCQPIRSGLFGGGQWTMSPHTHPACVCGLFDREGEWAQCQTTWLPQSPDLNPVHHVKSHENKQKHWITRRIWKIGWNSFFRQRISLCF